MCKETNYKHQSLLEQPTVMNMRLVTTSIHQTDIKDANISTVKLIKCHKCFSKQKSTWTNTEQCTE